MLAGPRSLSLPPLLSPSAATVPFPRRLQTMHNLLLRFLRFLPSLRYLLFNLCRLYMLYYNLSVIKEQNCVRRRVRRSPVWGRWGGILISDLSSRPRLFQFPNPLMKTFLSQFLPQMPLLVVAHEGFPRDTILEVPSLQPRDLTSLFQRQQQQSAPSTMCSRTILPPTSSRSLGAWAGVRRRDG